MSTHNLDRLFKPRSIALVGASPREKSAGRALFENVVGAGFAGELSLVNPRHREMDGRPCVARLRDLKSVPDLVVTVAPDESVLALAYEAAGLGVRAFVVEARTPVDAVEPLTQALRSIARDSGMRIVGPNCTGLIAPRAHLNASLSAQAAAAGDLAVISQSAAISAALIAWAAARNVGFSGLVSPGNMADVDFADLMDYFALDTATRAILLNVEELRDVQAFMSAARAAARVKPVIVIKSGRALPHAEGNTHSANLADPDSVYDAAFRRAGLLRVADLDELFDAAEALGRIKPFAGHRLAIIANGAGIGRLTADRLAGLGGELAQFSPATQDALDKLVPRALHANPVDIEGDAPPELFRATLEVALADRAVDAVMVMHAPTALSRSVEAAEAVAAGVKAARGNALTPKPVFAVWYSASPATDRIFEAAHIPHYERGATLGFMHLVRWTQAREFLMSTPPELPDYKPDVAHARRLVADALAKGHRWLGPVETAQLLEAYAILATPARLAATAEEAGELARLFIARAGACVVKIVSRDIGHKSDVGGVVLGLRSPDAVVEAVREMFLRVKVTLPYARVEGVTVHPMIRRPHARELFAGLADDPTFGPVVVFGRGGKAVEVIEDRVLALPPLDVSLAMDMIARTRVSRIIDTYRDVPRADREAVALTLVKLAQLAADVPQIRELDLNPLLVDEDGVLALDARIGITGDDLQRAHLPNRRFAVTPYPRAWERHIVLKDGTAIFLRPVRAEDEDMYRAFFEQAPANDLRLRFFAPIKSFTHAFVARLTQIDYARTYAVVALA